MSYTKMELAKSKIALHAGFWISLTAKLQWYEDDKVDTACTNGRYVKYSPKFVESLTLSQCIGLALHEVGHNMLAHPARAIGLMRIDNDCAQIAMDLVLNRKLLEYFEETRTTLHAELPPGGIFPGGSFDPAWTKYDDAWNMEKIFYDLLQQKQKNGGSFSQSIMDIVEPATNDNGTQMSATEMDALAKEWVMAAQQAANMAKARGMMPGMWGTLVADMVKSRIDWRAQLRDVFTKIAKEEMSWRRFNRRHIYHELYLPGMYSERLNLVGFITDTSGSMGSPEFALGLGAMNEIMEEVQPEQIRWLQCDTRVVHDETLTPDDLPIVNKAMKGRGGTALTPAFKRIQEADEEPELVVCLTDGYCETVDSRYEPKCPVVWLLTTDYTGAVEKSFGRIIRVEA